MSDTCEVFSDKHCDGRDLRLVSVRRPRSFTARHNRLCAACVAEARGRGFVVNEVTVERRRTG